MKGKRHGGRNKWYLNYNFRLAADAADADFKRNYESGHTSWRRGRSVDYTGGCSAGISEDEKKQGRSLRLRLLSILCYATGS